MHVGTFFYCKNNYVKVILVIAATIFVGQSIELGINDVDLK